MIEGIDTSGIRPSLWFSDCKIPHFPQLNENIKTDVCIIGGGITGLTTAYKLCSEGKEVVLLDDGNILSGETGRTTGHLTNLLDDPYSDLERIYGVLGARVIADSHAAAIDAIEQIIQLESIACHFKRVNGYLFLGPKDKLATLQKEADAATQAGLRVELLKEGNINHFKMGPCLRFYNQAKFHPLKYLAALAEAISKKGGKIFSLTHASNVKPGKVVEIVTADGFTIKAQQLVIATNAPVFDKAMLFKKQEANQTYVIGFSIKNENLEDALFWDTSDPYHYLRFHNIENNSHEFILSVGGEDHRTGKEVNKSELLNSLAKWAEKTVPQLGEIKYYWSGEVWEPTDHLAFIGPTSSEDNNIFLATGHSGNGLTYGTIAAILLTDQIMGRSNPWSEIYNPNRTPAKNLAISASHAATGMSKNAKDLKSKDVTDEEKIQRGEGVVIHKGDNKIAVYKDDSGTLHRCNAICPHKGGTVIWNNLEKSWDCPLHGSRFTPLGKVMDGPANRGLENETTIEDKQEISEH